MIEFTVNTKKLLQDAEKALGPLSAKAPQAVRTALNNTAKEARKLLLDKAKDTYAIKGTAFTGKSGSAMRITRATTARLSAKLHSDGSPIELYKFKPNPSKYTTGSARPASMRAKVLKANSFKPLRIDTRWAFVVQFKNGHVTLAQRVGRARLPIKTLYSSSIPQMIGDEKRVYNVVSPEIERMVQEELLRQIDKIKGGAR